MLELAGRIGDGAILNWLSAEDVRQVVPYVVGRGEGKENGEGRGEGAAKEIVARIFVLPVEDRETVLAIGRRAVAAYLNVPVYAAFHEWLGRGERLEPMWRAWKAGDRKGALEAIPEEVVDELIVSGSPGECRDHIQRYVDAGVTVPALALLHAEDLRKTIRELAPLHSTPSSR